jgi:hypothetical protein
VTIDQLSFIFSSPSAPLGSSIPMINNSHMESENIRVRMYSSLMGTFDFSAPSHHVYAMSSRPVLIGRSIPFCTYYFSDPWILPSLTSSCEGESDAGMAIPLSKIEIVYQVVLKYSVDPNLVPSWTDEEDLMSRPVWSTSLSCSLDFLDETLLSNKAMNGSKKPWADMNQLSYFLLEI